MNSATTIMTIPNSVRSSVVMFAALPTNFTSRRSSSARGAFDWSPGVCCARAAGSEAKGCKE